ncbi:ATP-binding protein [Ramlibacter albus]|uniref:histidine kinase n=1 Tax=Ramlibacter albus TaxID=2079448 RepID=A0A923S613_9BURK|nr:ATP-binding protein [Ramlibacter albus]MBC5768578.1 response regulator [Ramlibacter albus]
MLSSLHRLSVRQKLSVVLVAALGLGLLVAGIALVAFDVQRQARSVEFALVAQADTIGLASSAALSFGDAKGATENLGVLRANPAVAAAALFSADGARLASYAVDASDTLPEPAARTADVRFDAETVLVTRPVFLGKERIGTIALRARHDLQSRALEHVGALFLIMALSMAAALALASRLQRQVTQPLQELAQVARRIMQGDYALRAARRNEDEVGEVVDAFNAMMDELATRKEVLEAANSALRASEERYQLAVRGSSAGLWDWNLDAGTMFYSPRLKELLGYEGDGFPDVPGSIRLVVGEAGIAAIREALRAHFRHGRPYSFEVPVRLRSGEERWLSISGASLVDAQGRPFRMAGSVVDVTERRHVEDALRSANRAKDQFLATLAHELRNPLAPVRTGVEILRLRREGPVADKAIATMQRQLAHMVRLIDDLMDISRISTGKIRLEMRRIKLASALDAAVELSRPTIEAGGHRLELDYTAAAIELEADPTRLAQCVGNLLNNAAKYTPHGGRITLRARREGDATALIEVADNGLGIPAAMLDQVFTMFAQVDKTIERSQGGLGIGLSLVRTLVDMHGGTVTAASPGTNMGSTFSIRVPCLAASGETIEYAPASPGAVHAQAGARRILVVDDNVDAARTLEAVLSLVGHEVHVAHDGESALEQAALHLPDAVLLDIGMPGQSGYDVARRFRADPRFAGTLLVAITGWGAEADRRRSREAGFDAHLTKPVAAEDLLPLLREQRQAALPLT